MAEFANPALSPAARPATSAPESESSAASSSSWLARIKTWTNFVRSPLREVAPGVYRIDNYPVADAVRVLQMLGWLPGAIVKPEGIGWAQIDINKHEATIGAPALTSTGWGDSDVETGPMRLTNAVLQATMSKLTISAASASVSALTFKSSATRIERVDMTGVQGALTSAQGSLFGKHRGAALHFATLEVKGLIGRGLHPIDASGNDLLASGGTHSQLQAVAERWVAGSNFTTEGTLPQGARILVSISGSRVRAGHEHADAATQKAQLAIQHDGRILASITLTNAALDADARDGSGTIGELVLEGAPGFIQTLASSPMADEVPLLRAGVDYLRSMRIASDLSGQVKATNVRVRQSGGTTAASGAVAASVSLPNGLVLSVRVSDGQTVAAQTTAAAVGEMTLALRDHAGTEVAQALARDITSTTNGAARTTRVGALEAKGDVGRLAAAVQMALRHASPEMRAVLETARALPFAARVKGKGTATQSADGTTTIAGDFSINFTADNGTRVSATADGVVVAPDGTTRIGKLNARLLDKSQRKMATLNFAGLTIRARGAGLVADVAHGSASGSDTAVSLLAEALRARSTVAGPENRAILAILDAVPVRGDLQFAKLRVAETAGAPQVSADFMSNEWQSPAGRVRMRVDGLEANTKKDEALPLRARKAQIELLDNGQPIATFSGQEIQAADNGALKIASLNLSGRAAALQHAVSTLPVTGLPPIVAGIFGWFSERGYFSDDANVTRAANLVVQPGQTTTTRVSIEHERKVEGGLLRVQAPDLSFVGSQIDMPSLSIVLQKDNEQTSLTVQGGRIVGDQFTAQSMTLTGDPTHLETLSAPAYHLPEDVARILRAMANSGQFRTQIAANAVAFGSEKTGASSVTLQGNVAFVAGGQRYAGRGVDLALDEFTVTHAANGTPHAYAARSMLIRGDFSVGGDTNARSVQLRTGAAVVTQTAHGWQVDVNNTTGAGRLEWQGTARDGSAAGKSAPPADIVERLDLKTATPIRAGTYGKGFTKTTVRPGTMMNVRVVVEHHALTDQTHVRFVPALDLPAWVTAKGVDLERVGTEGVMKLRLGGFFDFDITQRVTGRAQVSMRVADFIAALRDNVDAAGAATSGAPDATDFLKRGLDIGATTGQADATLRGPMGAVVGRAVLDGSPIARLTASQIESDTMGVSAQGVRAQVKGDLLTHADVSELAIDNVQFRFAK